MRSKTLKIVFIIMGAFLSVSVNSCKEEQSAAVDVVYSMVVSPCVFQKISDVNPTDLGLDMWDYKSSGDKDDIYALSFLTKVEFFNERGVKIKMSGIGVVAKVRHILHREPETGLYDVYTAHGFLSGTHGEMNCRNECMPASICGWNGDAYFAVGVGNPDIANKYPAFKGSYSRKEPLPDGPFSSGVCVEYILPNKNNQPKFVQQVWYFFGRDPQGGEYFAKGRCPVLYTCFHRYSSGNISPSSQINDVSYPALEEQSPLISESNYLLGNEPMISDGTILDPNGILILDPNDDFSSPPLGKTFKSNISGFNPKGGSLYNKFFEIVDNNWVNLSPKNGKWEWSRLENNTTPLAVPYISDNKYQMDYICPIGYAIQVKLKDGISFPDDMSILLKTKNSSMKVPLNVCQKIGENEFMLVTSFIVLAGKDENKNILTDNYGNDYFCFPVDGYIKIGFPDIAGDLNGDNIVNQADMSILCENWMEDGMCYKQYDDPNNITQLNSLIGIDDFNNVSENWGIDKTETNSF